MDLPPDDHQGWDRLLAAVLDDDGAADDRSAPSSTTAEPTLEQVLDLQSVHARSGALTGDTAGPLRTI